MIFIDASALISMIAGEDDADLLADQLAQERSPVVSPIAMWEATAGLCRSFSLPMEAAKRAVNDFLHDHGIETVSIGEREYDLAIQAYADFGKGRHPAGLNMGDCFAYASAKAYRATLLFKGDDFSKTDVRLPGN